MIVAFLKPYSVYNPSERAGFPEGEAQRLIDLGIAAPVTKAAPETAEDAAPARGRKKAAPETAE